MATSWGSNSPAPTNATFRLPPPCRRSELGHVRGMISKKVLTHSGIVVPKHSPSTQVSSSVQASPSSHDPGTGSCSQPLAGSQESSVQALPSSQSTGGPLTQAPPEHTSGSVHSSSSLHGSLLGTCPQPLTGSQVVSVHGLPSSGHSIGAPTQSPSRHMSRSVQASSSSHGVPFSTGVRMAQLPSWPLGSHEAVLH